ncbi:MAG: DUF58 domain-containing protein [Clostridia bacterium]|jgi:hypothetical protein
MELIWISVGILLAIWLERKIYAPDKIRGISYQLEAEPIRLGEGESLIIKETVTNKGLLPFPMISTEIQAPEELEFTEKDSSPRKGHRFISRKSSLIWFQRVIRKYPFIAKRRGVHQVRLSGFRYADALLLDSHSLPVEGWCTLLVYPRIYALHQILAIPQSLFGDTFVRRWILEDYFFPSGTRDYQPGDNIRFIDWKKTAKYQALQTRTYDYTASNELSIIINLQTSDSIWIGMDVELAEDIIRVAASMVHAAAQEGFQIGLFANGGCIGYRGQVLALPADLYHGVDQLYECLARLVNFHSQNLPHFLENHSGYFDGDGNVVLITGYMNDEIERSLHTLKARVKNFRILALGQEAERWKDSMDLPIFPVSIKEGKIHD